MPQGDLLVRQPFDLGRTLTMGLVLRWRKENGGWRSGVVGDKLFMLRQTAEDKVEFRTSEPEESDGETLRHYLGLERDLPRLHEILSRCDSEMSESLGRHEGMCLMRPDPWECLITCVCTPGQRVRRLSSDIERLCEYHGKRLSLDTVTRYSFPKPDRLAQVSVADLSRVALRMPRRAEYVHLISEDVASGALSLNALRIKPYSEAKESLMQYGGVTSNVADCVLLFSLDKYEEQGQE